MILQGYRNIIRLELICFVNFAIHQTRWLQHINFYDLEPKLVVSNRKSISMKNIVCENKMLYFAYLNISILMHIFFF